MGRLLLLVEIGSRPLVIVTEALLPPGEDGVAYSVTLEATGGNKPYRWDHIAGTFPAGLTLDPDTGEISGVPEGTGLLFAFTVQVTDQFGRVASREFSLLYEESGGGALDITGTPPTGAIGEFYSFEWGVVGGTPPYSTVSMDWAPNPFNIDTAFGPPPSVFGICSEPTTLEITITVQDSADPPASVTETFSIEFV